MIIRAVLLDLLGTVVGYGDVAEGTEVAWKGIYAVLRQLGATVPYERFVPRWERRLATPLRPKEDALGTPFLGKIMLLCRSYGLSPDLAAVEQAAGNCLRGWDSHLYLPCDTLATLDCLRDNYAVALVSNFDHPPYVWRLLARLGLTDLFDYVVISGEVGIEKPDPRIFHMALDALGCSPQEAVFVGDSLEADIAGSMAVGCRPVLIDRRGRHPQFDGERIEALGELLVLLEQSGRR